MSGETKKVFIAHAYNDEDNAFVRDLCVRLRKMGVEAECDLYDAELGTDIDAFMKNVSNYDYILCICTEAYKQRYSDSNSGVSVELKNLNDSNCFATNKVIPILKTKKDNIPDCLVNIIHLSYDYENVKFDNYDTYEPFVKLLEHLYGVSYKTSLGLSPFKNTVRKIDIDKKIRCLQYISTAEKGKVSFKYTNNNGLYFLGEGDYEICTKWSGGGHNMIHAYSDRCDGVSEGINSSSDLSLKEIENYDYTSRCRTIKVGQKVVFVNNRGSFAIIEIKMVNHKENYIEFSYKILKDINC